MEDTNVERHRGWLICTVISLLCLRLFFAYHLRITHESVESHVDDERYYVRIASNLVEHHEFKEGNLVAFRPPLYPAFVAMMMAPSGNSFWLLQFAQNVLFLLAVLLTCWTVHAVFGRLAALLCCLLLLIEPAWLTAPQFVLSETLFIFLLACVLFVTLRLIRGGGPAVAAGLGVLIGLSALTRELGVYMGLGLLAFLVVRRIIPLKFVLVSVLAIFATILPWTARNYARLGTFVLITTNGPQNLYQGNNPEATGTLNWVIAPGKLPLWNRPGTEADIYRANGSAAVSYMLSHPLRTISLWPVKFWYLWRPMSLGSLQLNLDTAYRLIRYLFWIPFAIAAVYGMATHAGSWLCAAVAVWTCIGTAIHLLTYGAPNYHLPYEFFFAVPVTLVIVHLYRRAPHGDPSNSRIGIKRRDAQHDFEELPDAPA